MTVITVSRQYGSGGDEIASRVCEILGYNQFDKYLMAQAAREAGLTQEEMIDFPVENHKVRGFLDRLFGRGGPVVKAYFWKEDETGAVVSEEREYLEEAAIPLAQNAIRSACQEGKMLILGRGGQAVLQDEPCALHVRIEAPMEKRIQTIKQQLRQTKEEFHADIDLRREAQDLIQTRDEASRDYLQEYYHVDWADPSLYHLVLNTSKLTIEEAAQMIASLVRIFEAEHRADTQPTAA